MPQGAPFTKYTPKDTVIKPNPKAFKISETPNDRTSPLQADNESLTATADPTCNDIVEHIRKFNCKKLEGRLQTLQDKLDLFKGQ